MSRKIKKSKIASPTTAIKKKSIVPECISFSFKYLDNEKFGYSREDNYFKAFLERLCAISQMTTKELINSNSKAIRSHPVNWLETNIKVGFSHLGDELQSETAWQFSISSNKYGRVFGFMIDTVFYIVWLDHQHLVFS